MAESKRAKIERFKNKKTQLQVQLAQIATEKEMFHKTNDGTMHHFYSMRNPRHNAHRSRLGTRISKLKSQIEMYDRKIKELQQSIG